MRKTLLSLSMGMLLVGGVNAASLQTSSTSQPSAPAAACPTGPGFLSYNTDCTPVAGTVACGGTGLVTTAENSYYRRFVFAPGTNPNSTVATVQIGIERATSGTPGNPVGGLEIRVYTIADGVPLTLAALTQIGSATFSAADGAALTENIIPIAPAAVIDDPATKNLVIELFEPDLTAANSAVVFGSNATGTGITYLRAPSCGAAEPVDIASLGAFGNIKIIAAAGGSGLPVTLQEYTID
ncbi:hypothetical protein [Dokdonella sp.]|uniref:hypothetical protein n=1 Tax=Dokdonella sp. TaxID=2291710 RepID=UPI003C3CDFD6